MNWNMIHLLRHTEQIWAGWLHCETNSTSQRAGTAVFSRFLMASLTVHIFLLTWHPFLLASHLLNFLFLELFLSFFFLKASFSLDISVFIDLILFTSPSLVNFYKLFLSTFFPSLSLLTFLSSDISVSWHLSHDIILLASLLSLDIHFTQSWRSSLNAATTGLRNAIAPAHRRKPKVILAQQFDCTAHPPYCTPIAPAHMHRAVPAPRAARLA